MKVVILIGLPASGKSTFRRHYWKYEYVNQDELGSRKACISKFKELLAQGKDVIVDRTNINKLQRKYFIDIAKEYKKEYPFAEISAVYLHIEPEESIQRVVKRENHPTIPKETPLDKIKDIVYNFHRSFEAPELSEGFDKVLMMRM